MNAFVSTQKFANAANGNIAAFQSLADIVLNASEQMLALNFNAARVACAQASASAAPIVEHDPRAQFASQMGAQSKSIEQAIEYFTNVSTLLARTQGDLAEFTISQINETSRGFTEALDSFANSAPTGTSDMFAALKSAMSNATAAYENFVKNTRNLTETNIAAASQALQPMLAATTATTASKSSKKAA
jgi:phasin protein